MAAHPVSDELAARLVALFPLYNDSEIAARVRLNRTTVGKHRAVWRAAELTKLDAPPVDKMASLGPPPAWSSCSPQVRVAPLPPGVTAGAVTIPAPASATYPQPMTGPSDNKAAAVVSGDNNGMHDKLRRVIFFGDVHCPYHSHEAWNCFLAAAEAFAPDVLVCMGDMADVYDLSSYTRDPTRTLMWADEVDAVRRCAGPVRALAPAPEEAGFYARCFDAYRRLHDVLADVYGSLEKKDEAGSAPGRCQGDTDESEA